MVGSMEGPVLPGRSAYPQVPIIAIGFVTHSIDACINSSSMSIGLYLMLVLPMTHSVD